MPNHPGGLVAVRATISVSGVFLAAYLVYSVLVAASANSYLAASGYTAVYSGRWMAQTSLGALFSLFAVFLATRSTHRPGVLTLAGFLLAQGFATGYLNAIAFAGVRGQTWLTARALVNWMAYALALRTTQLFPRPLEPMRLSGRLLGWTRILVGPRRVWAVSGLLLALSLAARSDGAFQFGQLVVLVVAVATMVTNYRAGTLSDRRKIYWLLLGGSCLLLARIILVVGRLLVEGVSDNFGTSAQQLATSYGVVRSVSWTIANLGLLSCLLLAVFYEGAIDPRLVVRRTAVYSFAIGTVLFLFAMFENYAVEVVASTLGIREGPLEAAVGAALALLLKPLHSLLTRFTESALPKTSRGDTVSPIGATDGDVAPHRSGKCA